MLSLEKSCREKNTENSQHEIQLTLGWGSVNELVTKDRQEAREGGLILVHASKAKKATVTEMHFLLFSSGHNGATHM